MAGTITKVIGPFAEVLTVVPLLAVVLVLVAELLEPHAVAAAKQTSARIRLVVVGRFHDRLTLMSEQCACAG